jgi:hypothetical protein
MTRGVYILIIVGTLATIAALVFGLNFAIQKSERLECIKWQKWAQEYPTFYLTQWQDAQCRHYNVPINAPVK